MKNKRKFRPLPPGRIRGREALDPELEADEIQRRDMVAAFDLDAFWAEFATAPPRETTFAEQLHELLDAGCGEEDPRVQLCVDALERYADDERRKRNRD